MTSNLGTLTILGVEFCSMKDIRILGCLMVLNIVYILIIESSPGPIKESRSLSSYKLELMSSYFDHDEKESRGLVSKGLIFDKVGQEDPSEKLP